VAIKLGLLAVRYQGNYVIFAFAAKFPFNDGRKLVYLE